MWNDYCSWYSFAPSSLTIDSFSSYYHYLYSLSYWCLLSSPFLLQEWILVNEWCCYCNNRVLRNDANHNGGGEVATSPPDWGSLKLQTLGNWSLTFSLPTEEVILNEDRTTEEERRYIMEARKRAMQKRKKLRTLGKSRSTESEDEENEEEEGEQPQTFVFQL